MQRTKTSIRDEALYRARSLLQLMAAHRAADTKPATGEDVKHLLLELEMHQVKLQAQNEGLRKSQGLLQRAHDRYVALYEFAPVGYLTLNPSGFILEANFTAGALLGISTTALTGTAFAEFVDRDDLILYDHHRSRVLTKSGPICCELKLVKDDGTPLFAEIQSMLIVDREEDSVNEWMTVIDITMRKQAQEALREHNRALEAGIVERTQDLQTTNTTLQAEIRERRRIEEELRYSEARFRDFAQTAADWFWEVDADLRLSYLGGRYQGVLGLSKDQLIGRTIADIYAKHLRKAERWAHYRRTLRTGHPFEDAELEWVRPDGTVRWLRMSGTPSWDMSRRFLGYRGVGRDITEYRLLTEQARQHQVELEHAARLVTVGEMAATLAHELNQPLGTIANYCAACQEALRLGRADAPLFTEALEQVAYQTTRAAEIVRRVKHFVRKSQPQRTEVDLNALVKEVVILAQAEARAQGCDIEVKLARSLPSILADSLQLEQVLLNLLRNGIEAVEDAHRMGGKVWIATMPKDKLVQVTIRDNGVGLTPEALEQIFNSFYTTKQKGTGMGLAISRTIVEAHGGHIWAEWESEGGVTFHVTLPAE